MSSISEYRRHCSGGLSEMLKVDGRLGSLVGEARRLKEGGNSLVRSSVYYMSACINLYFFQ